ncbi:MAG: M20 family metallopeptidase [Candidatus Nezhaarchaeota archaeon]|nr:M20 family metallopeptidase [Candidatus Nezhaarchaeota archaeon]MCX8141563.1 M20 family metallopeptidase [Candidatus Nezhaarchaeota archaeon]MDW8049830.1 M20 family metallopeptidase [Nitrososphaerota archaeon]
MASELKVCEGEIVNLLVKLIRARSENPPGLEEEAAIIVMDYLKDKGLDYKVYEKSKGRTNVVCSMGYGRPNLAFICHLDVVPAGTGWSKPPYEGVVEEGKVYGRGSTDNKGALASLLVAASTVKDIVEKSAQGTVTIAAVADEEQGSTYGISYLTSHVGFKPDYAIVCESTGCNTIVVAEKGILRLRLKSRGRLAHGSRPHEGINAILKMAKVLVRMESLTMKYEPHPLFTPPTINVGTIVGGEAVNVVPSECKCTLDIRYLPSQTPSTILNEINSIIEELKLHDPQIDVEAEMISFEDPIVTSQDHPLVKLVANSASKVLGFKPKPVGIGGGTVAKLLVKSGVPSIVYGPGDESMCHRADEHIDVMQLKLAAQIYMDIMLSFREYLK